MKRYFAVGAPLAVVLLCGYAIGKEALKSGPQVGDKFPGAFNVLNVCNPELPARIGKKACFV